MLPAEYVFLEQVYTLSGRSDRSQAVAGPCWLQLCAVLGRSGIELSEHIFSDSRGEFTAVTGVNMVLISLVSNFGVISGAVLLINLNINSKLRD
jgi:hypothetical protein